MPQVWYVAGRLVQGFVVGVFVGAAWALWTIRRRRAPATLTEIETR